jgi:hypothetical protein
MRFSAFHTLWAGNILLPEKAPLSIWSGNAPVAHEPAKKCAQHIQ